MHCFSDICALVYKHSDDKFVSLFLCLSENICFVPLFYLSLFFLKSILAAKVHQFRTFTTFAAKFEIPSELYWLESKNRIVVTKLVFIFMHSTQLKLSLNRRIWLFKLSMFQKNHFSVQLNSSALPFIYSHSHGGRSCIRKVLFSFGSPISYSKIKHWIDGTNSCIYQRQELDHTKAKMSIDYQIFE